MEGALLRLRPKVMTVSTVVAGLLPIMWSTRVGAEVMKPLAAPVLGGMVSSLLHVLVVTPVIFSLIRERELNGAGSEVTERRDGGNGDPARRGGRTIAWVVAGTLTIAAIAGVWWWQSRATAPVTDASVGVVFETARAGDLIVTLRSADGVLRQGRPFTIEFRSAATNQLVDVGTVRVAANMAMPGMLMQAETHVTGASPPGRYTATGDFGMAGVWKLNLEWSGSAAVGPGSLVMNGDVQ